jgi:hypothetical protein
MKTIILVFVVALVSFWYILTTTLPILKGVNEQALVNHYSLHQAKLDNLVGCISNGSCNSLTQSEIESMYNR